WYGHAPMGYQKFAETLHAGLLGEPGAAHSLEALVADVEQPAIARASALAMLSPDVERVVLKSMRAAVADKSPLIRRAAARAMSDAEPRARAEIVAPLLADPVRDVRVEAAEALAGVPPDLLPPGAASKLSAATNEYVAVQQLNSDRPEAHLNLALLYAKEKRFAEAEAELKVALSLDPSFGPAAVNLADLYRVVGRDADGERVLRDAISHSPADASLEHSLGLALVRGGHASDALPHLASAARLDPASARFGYVNAVALSDAGHTNDAISELERVLKVHPYDRNSLGLIANLYEGVGNPAQALAYAGRLAELEPDDPQVSQLMRRLRAEAR
ncbi:MAG TPA: tetratricopeptide repeat protein, partial [Candidatus Acidoferrales bacterium]|nr:tetratricopeptide repeat protein [Candidatus Acidoferrales bacterium]